MIQQKQPSIRIKKSKNNENFHDLTRKPTIRRKGTTLEKYREQDGYRSIIPKSLVHLNYKECQIEQLEKVKSKLT